jgi:hypothetical protein
MEKIAKKLEQATITQAESSSEADTPLSRLTARS